MTTTSDPFDRTLGDWLASLESDEPAGLQALVVGGTRRSPQRRGWLARADLTLTLAPRPSGPAGTGVALVLVGALLAAIAAAVLVGGGGTPIDRGRSPLGVAVPAVSPDPGPAVVTGTWAALDDPGLRSGGVAAVDLYAGLTLVVGDEARLFDPADRTWTPIRQPHVERGSPAVAGLLDGSVLIVGGQATTGDVGAPVASAEVYSPVAASWIDAGSLAAARGSGLTATTLLDGRVLVAGGTEFAALQTAELWDPATFSWSPTGSMHEARSGHTATLLRDGRVLVTGGSVVHTAATATAEIYDPASGTWTPVAPMSTERVGHVATRLADGSVLVTGGHLAIADPGPQAASQRFDPATGAWSDAGAMLVGRYGHTATLLVDGRVLVLGGLTADGVTAAADLFDPIAGSWTALTAMTHARQGQAAAQLPSGGVLVVGGDQGGRATAERFLWQAQP